MTHRTEDRTELARCRPPPSSDRQSEPEGPEGGNRSPRETLSTKLQAGFFANEDFLGFWTVIICLRRCASCTPRKLSSRGGRGNKSQRPRLSNTWATQTWEGHKMQTQPSLHLWGLPECLSLSGLDLGGACSPGLTSNGSWWSNLEPEQCALWAGAGPVWLGH